MKFDVVIAGGGFAGAYCARTLGKALGAAGEKRVALVAERNVFVFQPMLAEVVGASLGPMDVVNPLRQFCRHVNVLQGNLQRVDWAKKEIVIDGGRFTHNHTIGFNHFVLALGSVTDLSRVPGMTDYAWPMKTVADALRLRAALINRLEEANLVEEDEVRARLLTFVVVGGGYTGVETAGQMLDFLEEGKKFYTNLRDHPLRVILVHSRNHLLEEIGERLGDHAKRVLEKRGMEIRMNVRVTAVTASRAILDDGSFIETHTVVSTVGNAPNPIVLNLCQQLGIEAQKGRIAVEPTMAVKGVEGLWAAGDCAAVPWKNKNEMTLSPPTAQFAQRQGKQLAANVARALRGAPPRPFSYTYMGQLATIGEREAVAEIFGFHFSGFIAWWMWRSIYLAKLPGIVRRLRVMTDWTFDLFFPRDLSVVLPPPEEVLRSIHLEKDEVLVRHGDRARSVFYLRRGAAKIVRPDGVERPLSAGSVIDQSLLDGDGTWSCDVIATESTDMTAFRGRAFDLLTKNLRLVPLENDGNGKGEDFDAKIAKTEKAQR